VQRSFLDADGPVGRRTGSARARGLSNHEIGASLYLSEATVTAHVPRLRAKLDAANRGPVAIPAHEAGLPDWLLD
jgi:DNA-binding NarL/FixJ family response regulator